MNQEDHAHPYFDDQDRWPQERLAQSQLRKLKRVLKLAYANLPFYRNRFDAAGVRLDLIDSFESFSKLPAFNKRDVLQELQRKASFAIGMELQRPNERAALCMTSGTLGSSFLYLPQRWRALRGDSLVRYCWWSGLRPGMRMLMAAPAWHGLAVQESRALERLGVTCVIPWGTFLPRYAGNFVDAIKDLRPEYISMFLPMLYAVLAECRRRRMAPGEVFDSVQHLVLVGAPMTPHSRAKLIAELGVVDIFEGLGNPEALTAMECSYHCGHHIFLDCCHVEILDPKTGEALPAGKRGTVVVTSLIPYGSIYIRYDSEDVGEILPQPCPCGRTWPLLEVYDRWANTVRVAGKEFFPYDVRLCLEELPQFIGVPFALVRSDQAADCLKILIQKIPAADPEYLGAQLRRRLKEKFQVEAKEEWTDQLPERWKGVAVIEEKDWRVSHV
jgi:phenylacetate-CoA ligase